MALNIKSCKVDLKALTERSLYAVLSLIVTAPFEVTELSCWHGESMTAWAVSLTMNSVLVERATGAR